MVIGIGFTGRLQHEVCNHGAKTHGLPFWRDEAVGESKSPKTAGISCMAFRKVRGKTYFGRMHMMFEIGGGRRSDCFVSSLLQQQDNVISKFVIEHFSKITRVTPEPRRVFVFFAVALARILANREDPGDDRQFSFTITFSEGQVKDIPRTEMESSDNLLIFFEEGIISRSKSYQWGIEVSPAVDLAMVGGTFVDEFGNSLLNELFWFFRKINCWF